MNTLTSSQGGGQLQQVNSIETHATIHDLSVASGKAKFLSAQESQAASRVAFKFSDQTTKQLQLKGVLSTSHVQSLLNKSSVNHVSKNQYVAANYKQI